MAAHRVVPLIIDTDVGDNIDDSFALALAARSAEVRLLGVTTVSGDTQLRARLAAGLLAQCGVQCPITPGCSSPLLGGYVSRGNPPQLHDCLPQAEYQSVGQAAFDLWEAVSSQVTGPIQLLCIGPLTNLALAVRARPKLLERFRITVMATDTVGPDPETNVALDPEAAYIVFQSGYPITVMPRELSRHCRFDRSTAERLAAHADPVVASLGQGAGEFLRRANRQYVMPHDAVALVAATHPDWFSFESGIIHVFLHPPQSRGVTVWQQTQPSKASVRLAVSMDSTAVLAYLFEQLGAGDVAPVP